MLMKFCAVSGMAGCQIFTSRQILISRSSAKVSVRIADEQPKQWKNLPNVGRRTSRVLPRLSDELNSLATANIGAIKHAVNQTQQGIANADWLQVVDGTGHKVVRQLNQLRAFFEQRGVATDASAVEVVKFWRWDGKSWPSPSPHFLLSVCGLRAQNGGRST